MYVYIYVYILGSHFLKAQGAIRHIFMYVCMYAFAYSVSFLRNLYVINIFAMFKKLYVYFEVNVCIYVYIYIYICIYIYIYIYIYSLGHDSVEDASTAMRLAKLKVEKGPKYGVNGVGASRTALASFFEGTRGVVRENLLLCVIRIFILLYLLCIYVYIYVYIYFGLVF
jgi:hypothetical protein